MMEKDKIPGGKFPTGKLFLPDGTPWIGDESSGFPGNSQPKIGKESSLKSQVGLSGLEGKPPPFRFGWGRPNPEV